MTTNILRFLQSIFWIVDIFTYANFKTFSPRETGKIAGKTQKKSPIFWTHGCHGNNLQQVNNNTNVIAKMLSILLENFVNISHGEKLGFLKVAPYGFLKSKKTQITTSKTAYGYFGKEWNKSYSLNNFQGIK